MIYNTIMSIVHSYRSFEEAREFVQSLGLRGQVEWREYCKSSHKPDDIPSAVHTIYKDQGWKGYGDFLGTGNVANFNREFLSFEDARTFVRALGLINLKAWKEYCKSGKKPDNIPARPEFTYRDAGWLHYADWLGLGSISLHNRKFLSFEEARDFARNLKLKNTTEWREYCRTQKPSNIPSQPHRVYKNKGWVNWADFLGTKNVALQNRPFRSFVDARNYVRQLGLKSLREWQAYCKSGDKPIDIPADPRRVYKDKGWTGYVDFLGVNR